MPTLPLLVAAVILLSMIVYVLTGGADFGGGVWDLFATGPRADDQRKALGRAIAPVWEANHVWLIVVIVLLFVCFPSVFSTIMTVLHIPLVLLLIGIVLRGSAFAFRWYSAGATRIEARSADTFAAASVATPIMLGVVVGAIASGDVTYQATGDVSADFIDAWLQPFPFAIGLFTLVLCAYLAAVYMTVEVDDPELQNDFRIRGLISAVVLGAVAFLCLWLARGGAPIIYKGLVQSDWALLFQSATGLAALTALWALWKRRYTLARYFAIVQCGLIVLGWALAQYPYFIYPNHTIANTATDDSVLLPVLIALGIGMVVLIPSFAYLFTVFKGAPKGVEQSSNGGKQ